MPIVLQAAALGKLNVLSRLGQPLDAEIEVLSLQPGEAQSLSARLGSPSAHAKAGLSFSRTLGDVRVSVGTRSGRPVLRVRSNKAVSEPYLDMLVELRSSAGHVARPYTVLLDPPGFAASPTGTRKPAASAPGAAPSAAAPAVPLAQAQAPQAPSLPKSRNELFGVPPKPAASASGVAGSAATAPAASQTQAQAPQAPSLPTSRDELFGVPAKPAAPAESGPGTREELFGLPPKAAVAEQAVAEPPSAVQWRGFVQNYTAYDYQDPSHWSRAVIRTQLGAQGGGGGLKWKATARIDVDPVYAGSDFYPSEVREDQRANFFLRETYVDMPLAGLELRLGKQNIVWGEMVGLFFADVVSARDQRDFILPDFEIIRIPQWAARAEYFGGNYHLEAIWLPYTEVDRIGKPGAEFYPVQGPPPAGFQQRFEDPTEPAHTVRNSNAGLRASTVRSGWDMSLFYYRSTDVNPTFYREVVLGPEPTVVFRPQHERIWQVGGTLGKDLGPTVLKAEVIYASGRKFNVTRLDEPTGVVAQDTLDYVVGLDFTFGRATRLNVQYFNRHFYDHDADLIFDRNEPGITLLLSTKIGGSWEPEILVIQSLNRSEGLYRPRLGWIPERNWRVVFGVDVFTGPANGFFGRFDDNDRIYMEVRRDF